MAGSGKMMAQYRVLVFCTYCDRTHPVKIILSLKNGPTQKATVATAYNGKALPIELVNLLKKDILCPETARPVILDDPERVYLVPAN
jgi:hypothetical protein